MRLLTYKVKGNPNATIVDKLVAFGTFSNYSHSELLFSDWTMFSSSPRDGGVRIKKLDYISPKSWDITEIDVSKDIEDEIRIICEYFVRQSIEYDTIGAIASATPFCVPNSNMFCSEAISKVISAVVPMSYPSASMSPVRLKKAVEIYMKGN